MAGARLIRTSRPPSPLDAPSFQSVSAMMMRMRFRFTCMASGFGSKKGQLAVDHMEIRKPLAVANMVAAVDGLMVEPTQPSEKVDLPSLSMFVTSIASYPHKAFRRCSGSWSWSLIIQSLVEKVIMDSRFFTVLGVAGTLLGSVLCFLEGVFLVAESYMKYFHGLYHHSDHGVHIMHLLIEALDMFLVGTAMLTFGIGLHVMFVGIRASKSPLPSSNFFGLFYLKEYPSWAGMKSIAEGKSKIGHALTLLLQAGVLDKFKSIPLVTGLDLACFAAAVFVSSVGLFILSQLSIGNKT